MKLIPSQQWICDVCGEIIENPKDGYVQWHRNSNMEIDDFVIVHHKLASPRNHHTKGCYKYDSDCDLKSFLGVHGIVKLHSLIDPGPYHMPEYKSMVVDIRKWLDFYKRLQLSYYEEARQYWDSAINDGYFSDSNEICIYLPNSLKQMIEHYEKKEKCIQY